MTDADTKAEEVTENTVRVMAKLLGTELRQDFRNGPDRYELILPSGWGYGCDLKNLHEDLLNPNGIVRHRLGLEYSRDIM